MLEKLKKAIDDINKYTMFFLLLPLYFIGLGLSKLLRKAFVKNNNTDGWKKAEKLRRDLGYYKEML